MSIYLNNKNRLIAAKNNLHLHSKYSNEEKYGANSRNALFIISGAKRSIGEVLCINNEVSELLGYEKNEVIGHNISKIMPQIIGENHSNFILNYMCSGRFPSETEKMIFPLNKNGTILPCTYLHRVYPSMQRGLQIIGFLKKITDLSPFCSIAEPNMSSDEIVIILTDQLWHLQAINAHAAKLFGLDPIQSDLHKLLKSEEKISLASLVPELNEPTFMERVRQMAGVETTFVPRNIQKIIETSVEIVSFDSAPNLLGRAGSQKSLDYVEYLIN